MGKCYRERELRERARIMRKNPTRSEARLWSRLCRKQLDGRKFRRQHVMVPYIVDFFCFSEKLAIEVDGSGHEVDERRADDMRRAAYLHREYDVQLIRFEAREVLQQTDSVVARIRGCWGSR